MRSSSQFRLLVAFLAMLALFIAEPAGAQQPADASPYSQDELDQLLAPIALYPDDLLTQILVASTYPLEVIEAARFVQKNPRLEGAALDDAVAQKNWDASVQSLTAFPQVLAMMDDKLEWTERLGDAFLADEKRVMDTVQSLRRRAEAAGSLASTSQQRVVVENDVVVIEPVRPDIVYVPVYDPLVVYGPWWAPAYPPWYWYPPPVYGYPVFITGIVFGIGWPVWSDHWGWCRPDWHGHRVLLHPGHNRFWNEPRRHPPPSGDTWQHSPYHRRGVPYADASTRDRFQPVNPGAVRDRQSYRGYAVPTPPHSAAPGVAGPARAPASVPPPATVPQAPVVRQSPAAPPAAQAPVVREPSGTMPQPRPPTVRQPPSVAQPSAPAARQAPVAPPPSSLARPAPAAPSFGTSRSAPSVFDPGASRSQAQMNAQRGTQSLQSIRPAPPPAVRAPSPSPSMRAPSASPAMRAPSPSPAMRAPSAPARPAPAAPPRGR